MLTLAVDTSTRNGSLAVLRDATVLAHAAISSDDGYSHHFCPGVDALLKDAGVSLSQLDLFAVASGPGSFTGLRVGLTAVKAWAEVFAKPIAGVSALEAIAAQVRGLQDLSGETLLAPVLDARRGQVYGAVYRHSATEKGRLRLSGEEVVAEAGEFLDFVCGQSCGALPVIFASSAPEVIENAVALSRLAGARVEKVSPLLAPVIGLLGYRQALRGKTVDALGLDASYVRRSDAELKWKG